MSYIAMHAILLGYFWIAEYYTTRVMKGLPLPWQILIGLLYLVGLLATFIRVDLICIDSRLHPSFRAHPHERLAFSLHSLLFYLVIVGVPALLVFNPDLQQTLKSYWAFLWIVMLVNGARYAIPSHERYLRRFSVSGM